MVGAFGSYSPIGGGVVDGPPVGIGVIDVPPCGGGVELGPPVGVSDIIVMVG